MSPAPAIGVTWSQFGDYHMDRLEALGAAMPDARVVGIELAPRSSTYDWPPSGPGRAFEKITLFADPQADADHLPTLKLARRLSGAIRRARITHLFVAGYEQPSHFLAAWVARLSGVRVFVMLDSKWDDKPRRLRLEIVKRVLMMPYHGGLVSGRRAGEYLRFLGLRRRPVAIGYDVVSLDRMRRLCDAPPPPWKARAFVAVARLVPKKNILTLLRGYARYRALAGDDARPLRLCGSGPEAAMLADEATALGIAPHVHFLGWSSQEVIAGELAGGLALLLPSQEEQWGLVVNEALAFGLPVVVSDNVGARDVLVRNLSNGFVLDPYDIDGWAEAMRMLGDDEAMWQRFAARSAALSAHGDVSAFVAGVQSLQRGSVSAPVR